MKQYSIAPYTTFQVAGRAEHIWEAKNPAELVKAVKKARNLGLDYRVIAGGSNVVFDDGLFRGLIIRINGGQLKIKGNLAVCDSGVPLSRLVSRTCARGLAGLETLAGIPGSVGGGIVGNAGAYGHTISDPLQSVEVFDGMRFFLLSKKECHFAYRESIFKNKEWFLLRTHFSFKLGRKEELRKTARDIIKLRLKKYQPGLRCPGSFFKNILVKDLSRVTLGRLDKAKIIDGKVPAGYLLESVGARGMHVGGIRVADYHGNLLVNDGKGTFKDVKSLAGRLKSRVRKKFGIELKEEVRYMS